VFARLQRSLSNEPEQRILRAYGKLYGTAGFDIPALIPQVYLHYDPYTARELGNRHSPLTRQRMDFLLLLPNRARVVLELDGRHHYADGRGMADPRPVRHNGCRGPQLATCGLRGLPLRW
jgi:hypothetical protein